MSGRVAVVTGGGGGIGAAIAMELGRRGDFVVTVDPLVSLDGSSVVGATEPTTAERIVAAGGTARATSLSVTDRGGLDDLFGELVDEHGRVDAVVNVAGISRPTGFGRGSDDDWRAVLEVHLDGYRNVLAAALPRMAEAGHGRILGVTSGSGWRAADAGAYASAKRAVAALTWQLGRCAPEGVVVNAISPIAVTRMVTAALAKAPQGSSGGLQLGSMPEPEAVAPLGAAMVADDLGWCSGQIVFAGGPEAALIEPPRFLEVVHTSGAASMSSLLEAVTPALVAAEQRQSSGGGSNPRFGAAYSTEEPTPGPAVSRCAVVGDGPHVVAALERRGVQVVDLDAAEAIVVGTGALSAQGRGWERVLRSHDGLVDALLADAAWTRHGAQRLVWLVDATEPGGRSRAQALAQLSRAAPTLACAVSVESSTAVEAAELAAHLVASAATTELSGAELACGDGWVALRSHPRPLASTTFGAADHSGRFVDVLRELA